MNNPFGLPDYVWSSMTYEQQQQYAGMYSQGMTIEQRAAAAGYSSVNDFSANAIANYNSPEATAARNEIMAGTFGFGLSGPTVIQVGDNSTAPSPFRTDLLSAESLSAGWNFIDPATATNTGRQFTLGGVGQEIGDFFGQFLAALGKGTGEGIGGVASGAGSGIGEGVSDLGSGLGSGLSDTLKPLIVPGLLILGAAILLPSIIPRR